MKVFYLHKYSYTCKEKVKADFSKVNPSEMYEKAASLNWNVPHISAFLLEFAKV